MNEDNIRADFAVGRGRGRAGFRSDRTLFPRAKRLKGGGNTTKCPELGFELYQWLVDTVDNLKCRVKGWMLMMQARILINDIEKFVDVAAADSLV